jgi:hypothetical protein
MSDKELLDYFKNYQGSVCGSINPMQLDRIIVENKSKIKPFISSKFIARIIRFIFKF